MPSSYLHSFSGYSSVEWYCDNINYCDNYSHYKSWDKIFVICYPYLYVNIKYVLCSSQLYIIYHNSFLLYNKENLSLYHPSHDHVLQGCRSQSGLSSHGWISNLNINHNVLYHFSRYSGIVTVIYVNIKYIISARVLTKLTTALGIVKQN